MKIKAIDVFQIDLEPHVVRRDAIQAFTKQETVFVRIRTDEGAEGLGYTYTIGTGGRGSLAPVRAGPGTPPDGGGSTPDRTHLAQALVREPCHGGRRDHESGALRHRHGALGPA